MVVAKANVQGQAVPQWKKCISKKEDSVLKIEINGEKTSIYTEDKESRPAEQLTLVLMNSQSCHSILGENFLWKPVLSVAG